MEDIKRTDVWQKKLVIIQISEYNRIYDWRNTMNYLTTIEMSKKWGITSRRIAILCEQGRIDGVVKKGKTWIYHVMQKSLKMQEKTIIVNEVYWYAKG